MRSLLFLFLLLVPALGSGQTANKLNLKLAQVASGFTSPVGMACPDDGTFRIFVFEQGGKIYIIENGQVLKEPFLNISNRLDGLNIAYSEKGLLGMAFHPYYKNNGQFYLY